MNKDRLPHESYRAFNNRLTNFDLADRQGAKHAKLAMRSKGLEFGDLGANGALGVSSHFDLECDTLFEKPQ